MNTFGTFNDPVKATHCGEMSSVACIEKPLTVSVTAACTSKASVAAVYEPLNEPFIVAGPSVRFCSVAVTSTYSTMPLSIVAAKPTSSVVPMMFMSPLAATERFSTPDPYSTLTEIIRFDSEKPATVSGCGWETVRLASTESGVLVRLPLTSIVVPNIEKPPENVTVSVFVAMLSPTAMVVSWNEIAPLVPGIENAPISSEALKIVGSRLREAATSTVVPKTAPSNASDMPAGMVDVPTVHPSGATENSKYVAVSAPPPTLMIGWLPVDEPTAMARHGVASESSAVIEIGTPLSTPKACISEGGRSPEA